MNVRSFAVSTLIHSISSFEIMRSIFSYIQTNDLSTRSRFLMLHSVYGRSSRTNEDIERVFPFKN